MYDKESLALYESIHAVEERVRDRIALKTQLIFTVIFVWLSIGAYFIRFVDYGQQAEVASLITLLVLSGSVGIVAAVCFNLRAFISSDDRRMPTAAEVQKWQAALVEYAQQVELHNHLVSPAKHQEAPDPAVATRAIVIQGYVDCATGNAGVNMLRQRWVSRAVTCLLFACIPLSAGGAMFVALDMDAASPRKASLIRDDALAREVAGLARWGCTCSRTECARDDLHQ